MPTHGATQSLEKCQSQPTTSRLQTAATDEDFPTTTSSTSMELKVGVADLVDKFDTFLLDMWGVMHDGSRPYDGVLDVVNKLRQLPEKKMIILSNSSKRRDNSVRMLKKLGFNPEVDFAQIITSGEVAYQMLSGELECWDVLDNLQKNASKKKVFVFGSGDEDAEYLESCG